MAWDDEAPPFEDDAPRQKRGRAPRVFTATTGVREKQRAFISLTGASGGGKTKSALELAVGLCSITGGEVFVVDSENGRAKKYAPRPGEKPSPFDAPPEGKTYAFRHVDFQPPFDPDSYLDALRYCESQGAGAVIFDSMSHEHAGEGGRLDSHDKVMNGNEKKNFAAWRPNSDARNRLLWGGFFRSPCHIILCFRAKDKSEQRGSKIIDAGFTPIGGADFIFEADAGILFMPQASGVPTWRSELRGEQSAIKLPDEYRGILDDGRAINYTHGVRMARWLNAGGQVERSRAPVDEPPSTATSGGASLDEKAPPPSSSPRGSVSDETFPGDVVTYDGAGFDPQAPCDLRPLVAARDMTSDESKAFARALADCIKRATPPNKSRWIDLNEPHLRVLEERGVRSTVAALRELAE